MMIKRIVLFVFMLVPLGHVFAMTPAQHEIVHLLGFIESSSCTFVRNDNAYPAKKAVSHIKRKYNYFKDKITSTEDFIRLAATKSSMSNKPYHVICGNEERYSSAWLHDELHRYRQEHAKK